MAIEEQLVCITRPANADLSSSQYLFGTINSSGNVAVAGAEANADGVIQNDPAAAGRATTLAILGVTKVVAGGAVTIGDEVASNASGQAVTVASGDFVLGKALSAASAAGDVISILFMPRSIA